MLGAIVHLLALVSLSPLQLGLIFRTRAILTGRQGPPILQPYYDILKLFRKGMVLSRSTTWIFIAGPVVSLAASLLAGTLIPLGPLGSPLRFAGDFILLMYLLALGRFFTTAAALDTASSFEGMGAAREVTFASLIEPTMLFALLALSRMSGSLSLSTMMLEPWSRGAGAAALVFVTAAVFVVFLAENCRIPFDDPTTHLELTMIHEVMVLDHSGPLLGLVLYGAAVKLYILELLLADILMPVRTNHLAIDVSAVLAVVFLLSVLIGVVESAMARLRLRRVANLLSAACLLSAFGFLLLVR